jgi:Amt family ammonium transporter
MHCFSIACVVSVLWFLFVYSLAFGDGGGANEVIGGFGKALFLGVGFDGMTGDIPESLFFTFQMTFAVITPALIVGAFVERMKFAAVLMFSALWVILVYAPVTHWLWGGGFLAELGVMDFAGGLVVHATCGTAAIVVAVMLGRRRGDPPEFDQSVVVHRPAHMPGLTMMGAALLWVGWFGFNAGSALAADGSAGMAILVTHVAAATGATTWMFIEWVHRGKPTMIGIATGTIAGLATITPASGFVGPAGGIVIGLAGGIICYLMCIVIHKVLKIDDTLDVFAVHGVGGMVGIILTSFFAATALGGVGLEGSIGDQLWKQLVGIGVTVAWTALLSVVILKFVKMTVGLRVSEAEEIEGLDVSTHGERGYNL